MLSRLGPTLALAVGVVTAMFVLTYIPQLSVLVFVNGPLAVVTTVLLVLNESSAIINLVARSWLLRDALLDTFDGTLVSKGLQAVVAEGRAVKKGGDPIDRLGRVFKSPFDGFSIKGLVRYFMYLPLNAIPVVGTVVFIVLQGEEPVLLA